MASVSSARVPQKDNRALSARELREKYNGYINADPALVESRRWIEEVTKKRFKSDDFRESLADGTLLCELIEIVGDVSLGRINRISTAYAGIDNLNLFFKACEGLGLKKLHLFDVADLQEVTTRRGDSISSRAKESQRRLQNVAITILWLARAARKRGYQGPALDSSFFHHLLPEVKFQGKKERGVKKRHSSGELELKSRGTQNIPPKKRDKVFDKIDIKDRKEKFLNLENKAKKESTAVQLNRRSSTGGILKRIRDNHWQHWGKEDGLPSNKEPSMPDPKFHEKQELYNRRERQAVMESAALQDKTRRKESGSEYVTSPPPVSLGRKVEVDLKQKQKKFEGLDRQAQQQSAVLSGKSRPVSWGPREIRPALKKQNSVDVAFKDKHKAYEELQRQANTESAVLQGKQRPQFDGTDGRPEKVPLAARSDVKLREKRKSFEQRDSQAQREKAVLEGYLHLSPEDSKGKRPNSVVVPKREQIKLGEKKATFEQLDEQAQRDASILRGEHRPPLTETDGRKKSSKVGLSRDSNVGLLEKQRTFEDMDYRAWKESEVLQKNKRKSFESSVKEPTPLSTSNRQWGASDIRKRNLQERPARPVSNYYEYSNFNDDLESHQVMENVTSEDRIDQVSVEEPIQSFPAFESQAKANRQYQRDEQRAVEDRRKDYFDYAKPYEDSRRRDLVDEVPLEIDVSNAKNLSYRDMVRAPRKKPRETFIRETNNVTVVEEMPWRREVREVKDKKHLSSDEEQGAGFAGRPSSPRSELGKAQYLELVVPPSKKAMDSFANDREATEKRAEEMQWRKEAREIKRSSSGEDPPLFMSRADAQPTELTRIRPPSLKTRDTFLTAQSDEQEEEMPWRKEVRELKERPRSEEDEYRDDSPPPEVDVSTGTNLRRLSYKEFTTVPSRKRRDVFQVNDEKEKDKEEMPWRKEVREIQRTKSEEEEEPLQKSCATLAQSSPEGDNRIPAYTYQDVVTKPLRKARDRFTPRVEKQEEEMPWRKEVREIKRTITEDEQVQRSSAVTVHSSPDDFKDPRSFSYRDFIAKPRKKSEGFLSSEEKEKEEMPWRKEVRELRDKGMEEEEISQSSRWEVESAPNISLYRNSGRNDTDAQKLSYNDFVCPPSNVDEPQEKIRRKSTKVRDLTQKFATIEREKNLPKEKGPPSRKSLVDVAELKRIERDMKTRSWHGFPSNEYDSDDDYDVKYRRRRKSQEEWEERLRDQHHRENVSGLEQYDDVFQDPEGYFDQMRGPPHEKTAEQEVGFQYKEPSCDDQRAIRSTNESGFYSPHDQNGQSSVNAAYEFDYYQNYPVDGEPRKRKPSDDRVVVKQTWIQPNRVKLAETQAPSAQEHQRQRNANRPAEYLKNERPYLRDFEKMEPVRDGRGNEDNQFFPRPVHPSEDKCFIEEGEHPRQNRSYYSGYNGFGSHSQVKNDDWLPPKNRPDIRGQRNQIPTKNDIREGPMVFGGPIVVTARRNQQPGQPEQPEEPRRRGKYDFVPTAVRPYEDRKAEKAGQDDKDFPAIKTSYNDRANVKSFKDGRGSMESARDLVLQDIRNINKGRVVEPAEEGQTSHRPQVFGVFARTDPNEVNGRGDAQKQQSSDFSVPTVRGHMHYLDGSQLENPQDWRPVENEKDELWHAVPRPPRNYEISDYENSASNLTELKPAVVSVVESQVRQWGTGGFQETPQKDEQRTGRQRVMNFSNDHDDIAWVNRDDAFRSATGADDRRREQKEKEEMVRKQLQDAEYREKYRKEFEEKNRKHREKSNYLMSLQMRAAMGSDEDVGFGEDTVATREKEFHSEQLPNSGLKNDAETGNPRLNGDVNEEDVLKVVAAEEDYWHHKIEKRTERQIRESSRHEPPRRKISEESQPRINGIDFVGEEDIVHREYKDFDHDARIRKLQADEKQLMTQEGDRLRRERAALKQQIQIDEPIIAPAEKPPVEFTVNEEVVNSLLAEENKEDNFYDENENRKFSETKTFGKRDVFHKDEEHLPQNELEFQGNGGLYSDEAKTSRPQGKIRPINGYHHQSETHQKAPAEILRHDGDPLHHSRVLETDPEMNGFDGYSIYETFIHGESNHVICLSCGTSIEKSPAMYIAELDRYWHVNCFNCVVCRAWFGDEYSPVLQITNSMLHCERCYITSEGERCTEV